jgi:CheY-like chemotaxis protein
MSMIDYNILAVDDDPAVLKALQRLGRAMKMSIYCASRADEARQVIADFERLHPSRSFDLVLMDVMLEPNNRPIGIDLLCELKIGGRTLLISNAPDAFTRKAEEIGHKIMDKLQVLSGTIESRASVLQGVVRERGRPQALICDDEPATSRIIGRLLRKLGCDVHERATFDTADETIRAAFYHIVFIDLCWPRDGALNEKAGLELLEKVKAVNPTSVCILHSQHSARIDRLSANKTTGIEGFVHSSASGALEKELAKIASSYAPFLLDGGSHA